jgi:hypothetical protein
LIDYQSHLENRLERRLIPTGKSPSGIGGFELRRGQCFFPSVGVFVGAAIKTVKFIVQDTGEGNLQLPPPRI